MYFGCESRMISSKINLRPVTLDDARLLFDWRNDPCVRSNSFHSEPIEYVHHVQWLVTALQDEHQLFYIMENDTGAMGQVRLSIENDVGLISYSIAAAFRGQDYGKRILQLLENTCVQQDLCLSLKACVRKNNIASQRVFADLGYDIQNQKDDYKIYTKGKLCLTTVGEAQKSPGGGTVLNQ
jgi:RimJ/RimL family protein N-acetyltransferase